MRSEKMKHITSEMGLMVNTWFDSLSHKDSYELSQELMLYIDKIRSNHSSVLSMKRMSK